MCGSGAVGSCVQGWGVKRMNAAIKAALSEEPLEGHDSKGSWETKFHSPHFLAAFIAYRPSETDVYQTVTESGPAGWGKGRGTQIHPGHFAAFHCSLKILQIVCSFSTLHFAKHLIPAALINPECFFFS